MLLKTKQPAFMKQWRNVSLRVVLVVPFALQVFAMVGLTGYLSFRNGQKAVNDLATRLRQEVSDRVDQHLDNYMAVPQRLVELNGDAIKSGLLDPRDLEGLGRYFWEQTQSFDVGYIAFGTATGEYAAAGYYLNNQQPTIDQGSDRLSGDNLTYTYATDAQGRQTKIVGVIESTFQQEAWYARTVQAGQPRWSSISPGKGNPNTFSLSINRPVYDDNQKLMGVLRVDQQFTQISSFLRQVKVSPASRVFILERNGLVVASSGGRTYRTVNGQIRRLAARDSRDPLLQAAAQTLNDRLGGFNRIETSQQLEFQFDGQRQFLQVTPWRDELGLDWLVVVTVPESNFMAQINANTRITILLCVVALILSIALGILTSRWITQPILDLNAASKAIYNRRLNQIVEEPQIYELRVLTQSFNRMVQQLRDLFTALETTNEQLEIRVKDRTDELSQALNHLQQTQAQLIHQEKMSSLGQMVAGIAHEINNPISFIHGNLAHADAYTQDLLNTLTLYQKYDSKPPDEIQQQLDKIDIEFLVEDLPKLMNSMQEGTKRICDIVLSLRNFSRLDEAETKVVDIHEGLENTLMLLQHRLKETSTRPAIELIRHYGDLPPVECYPGQLNQVFMNILSNAIDAIADCFQDDAKEASKTSFLFVPTIRITTEVKTDAKVMIRIRDNARGMTEAVRSKIFDPFFTTKPVGQGTGLGLSISYQIIVQKHQGTLSCTSVLGQGTEFEIEIPVNQPGIDEESKD